MSCSKKSRYRNGRAWLRAWSRVAGPRMLVAGALLGVSAWSSAATLVPVGPNAPLSAGGLGEPWVLTPGAPNPNEGELGFQCVLSPGESGAPGAYSCNGYLFFRLFEEQRLSIVNASIDGLQCQVSPYYAACPVDIGAGMEFVATIGLKAGPFARTGPYTALLVNGQGNFTMTPFNVPLQLQPTAKLSIRQPLVVVVPGQPISGRTELVVNNQGPSGAANVQISEQLPPFMTADPEAGTGCTFDTAHGQLLCQAASLAPGASLRIPLTLEAPVATPTTQVNTSLTVLSDAGNNDSVGTVMVTGDPVFGVMELDPGPFLQPQVPAQIKVSMYDAAGATRGLPDPGMPLRWTLRVPDGVQVQSFSPDPDSTQMSCSYADGTVACYQPAFGSGQLGSDANASISVVLTASGRQDADLCWSSSVVQDCTSISLTDGSTTSGPKSSAVGH